MALSPAEKQKTYRARQKLARQAAPELSNSFVKGEFHKFIAQRHLGMEENMDAVGIHISGSLEDPVQNFRTEMDWADVDTPGIDPSTSLGRATLMVGVLLDAATELAQTINDFKAAEVARAIETAFQDSANLPGADVEGQKATHARISRLKAVQATLSKQVRHTLPVIHVKE